MIVCLSKPVKHYKIYAFNTKFAENMLNLSNSEFLQVERKITRQFPIVRSIRDRKTLDTGYNLISREQAKRLWCGVRRVALNEYKKIINERRYY